MIDGSIRSRFACHFQICGSFLCQTSACVGMLDFIHFHPLVTENHLHFWLNEFFALKTICSALIKVHTLGGLVLASNWDPIYQFWTGECWDVIPWSLVEGLQMGKNSQNQGGNFGSWLLDLRLTWEHFCSLPMIISGGSGLQNLAFGGLGGLQKIRGCQAPFLSFFVTKPKQQQVFKTVLVTHVRAADDDPPKLFTHDLGED